MKRDSRMAWSQFDVEAIPTKSHLADLYEFVERASSGRRPRTALDVGCGTGAVTAALVECGLEVVGIDINAAALDAARRLVPGATFYRRDITANDGLDLGARAFDLIVVQLVISVVGTPEDREQTLRNVRKVTAPGGWLYVSASGRSDDINPGYAELYAQDRVEAGEDGSYYSRDDAGHVLYLTHHFTQDELEHLLERCGFTDVRVNRRREHSSRRPSEAAWFLYATCRAQ